MQWTPSVTGKAMISVTFNITKNSWSGLVGLALEGRLRLYDQTSYRNSVEQPIWPAASDSVPIRNTITLVGNFDVTSGVVHTLFFQYRPDTNGSINWSVSRLQTYIETTRKVL